MAIIDLASIDATNFQQNNPGGGRNLYAILAKHIVGVYPAPGQISADGTRVTALPTLVATKKFSHYSFPDGTLDTGTDDGGDPGFQSNKQSIEFMLAGSTDAIHGEVRKWKNAGLLFLVEDKSGDFNLLGSTDDPIFVKSVFKLGKKGNDKRGYTVKGEVDGLNYGVLKLQTSLVATLTFNPEPVI
jgi:hypothetical protein